MVSRDKTRGKGHRQKHKVFQLNVRKNFFTLRVPEHWNRLSRDIMDDVLF